MPPNFNDGGRASAYVYGGGYGAGAAARRGSTGSTGGSNAEKADGNAAGGAGADGGAEKPLRNFELLYDEVIRLTDDFRFTRLHSTHMRMLLCRQGAEKLEAERAAKRDGDGPTRRRACSAKPSTAVPRCAASGVLRP